MPTETRIRIKRNPYQGYEVWLWGNGELTRRSFDNSIDLSSKLAADCVSDQDIEDIAAYLAKAGLKTLVLERRHVIGGAAVSEEIVPGFTFSVSPSQIVRSGAKP